MLTREQENRVEQMAEHHGRLLVRHGYADGSIRLTLEDSKHYLVTEAGTLVEAGHDWTDSWTQFTETKEIAS
jgi:hypothetical protein